MLFSQTSIFLRDALYSCRVTARIAVRLSIRSDCFCSASLSLRLSHSVLLQEEVGLDEYMINSDYTDKSQFKDADSVIQRQR